MTQISAGTISTLWAAFSLDSAAMSFGRLEVRTADTVAGRKSFPSLRLVGSPNASHVAAPALSAPATAACAKSGMDHQPFGRGMRSGWLLPANDALARHRSPAAYVIHSGTV
jgi:hypothetical protein